MIDSSLRLIATVEAVLAALDGPSEAAGIAGCTAQNLCNAQRRGRLPPSTFLLFTHELARRGLRAPPQLWGIKPLKKRRPDTRAHMTADYAQRSGNRARRRARHSSRENGGK
jgi:hypothetical protein